MRRAARLGACLAIGALSACSLLVDTSGLSGGDADGGGTSGVDAPNGVDAPSGADAPSGGDAGADADASRGDDGSTAFVCDASFCDDFDDSTLGTTWSNTSETRGTLSLVTDAVSPPHAALAALASGSGNADIDLTKSFTGLPQHVRCELDMKLLDAPPSNAEVDYVYITTAGGGYQSTPVLYFAHFTDAWAAAEYASSADAGTIDRRAPATAPPIGSWFHLTIETDGSQLSIAYDGVPAGALGGLTTFSGTHREIVVGIPYVTSSVSTGAHSVEYDNVACHVAL